MKKLYVLLLVILLTAPAAFAGQPPKTPAASPSSQDGFVPVEAPVNGQDAMPAPRLVAAAYGFIWIVLFGYLWSIRTRLAGVEREIEVITRRVSGGKQ